jgi:hypothetical protein
MAGTVRTGIVGATVTQGGGWGAKAHVPALPPCVPTRNPHTPKEIPDGDYRFPGPRL